MGIMIAKTSHYWWSLKEELVNIFSSMFSGFMRTAEVIGYTRAASELARMGYHEQAKEVMMQIRKAK